MTINLIQMPSPSAAVVAYADHIAALDAALGEAISARQEAVDTECELAKVEADIALTVEGKNAEERKANQMRTQLENDRWCVLQLEAVDWRTKAAEADRRATVEREYCRMFRAVLAVHARIEGE